MERGCILNRPSAPVILVDEEPDFHALEHAQSYLRLPTGRALTDFSHEYGASIVD